EAVREHYLPIQANGELPKSQISTVVSIADKLDSVISFISVGLMPTGSQDPYSLRRQAIGVLRIIEDKAWDIRVEELLAIVEIIYVIEDEKIKNDIHHFLKLRVQYLFVHRVIDLYVVDYVTYKYLCSYT